MGAHEHRDRGQAAIMFVIVAVVLAGAAMSALAHLGVRVRERVRRSVGGRCRCAGIARRWTTRRRGVQGAANGSILVSWEIGPGPNEVTVVVEVDDEIATARATYQP